MNVVIPRFGDLVLSGIIKPYTEIIVTSAISNDVLYGGSPVGDMPISFFEKYMNANIANLYGSTDKVGHPCLMISISPEVLTYE